MGGLLAGAAAAGAGAGAATGAASSLAGWGTLLGGLGSVYGGWKQGQMADKMFAMQKSNLLYNRNEEEKRLAGLGSIGGSYGASKTLGSL